MVSLHRHKHRATPLHHSNSNHPLVRAHQHPSSVQPEALLAKLNSSKINRPSDRTNLMLSALRHLAMPLDRQAILPGSEALVADSLLEPVRPLFSPRYLPCTDTPADKPAASSPFGGGTSTASPAFGQQSSSPFGQAQQQPQQQQQSNPFSFGQNAQNNTTQTPFGQTSSSGQQNSMFGGQQNQSGGFSFGQNSNQQQTQQNNSPFGGGGGTSTFGGFGQNNQQQQQQSGGGLFSFGSQNASTPAFGSGTTSQAPATGTLFGQSQPQQQQSGNLFGQSSTANTTGGGGFSFGGTNQAQSQPQQNSSLFSFGANKPATGGAAGGFGSGGGMFSSTNTQNQQPAQGGTSLFGGGLGQSQPQQNTGSMFGGMGAFGKSEAPSSQPQAGGGLFSFGQSTNTGGGLLGASQPPQGQAPNLNASPYGASPLFSSVQSKPAPAPFASDASANDKALFSRSPVPGPRAQNTPKSFNKITRIRFMTPSASNPALNDRTGSPSLGDVNFGPGTFSARSNIKRLELDRKSSLGDLRSKSASVPPSATNSPRALLGDKSMFLAQPASGSKSDRVAIDPVADATASPGQLNLTLRLRKDKDTAAPTPPPRTLTPAKTRHGHTRSPTVEGDVTTSEKASEYVCSPPIAELERFSPSELARVENLKVERPGFGSLTWREPVFVLPLFMLVYH